jgi:hypothetical protein
MAAWLLGQIGQLYAVEKKPREHKKRTGCLWAIPKLADETQYHVVLKR